MPFSNFYGGHFFVSAIRPFSHKGVSFILFVGRFGYRGPCARWCDARVYHSMGGVGWHGWSRSSTAFLPRRFSSCRRRCWMVAMILPVAMSTRSVCVSLRRL
jgi:hypothetical protein